MRSTRILGWVVFGVVSVGSAIVMGGCLDQLEDAGRCLGVEYDVTATGDPYLIESTGLARRLHGAELERWEHCR